MIRMIKKKNRIHSIHQNVSRLCPKSDKNRHISRTTNAAVTTSESKLGNLVLLQ